MKDLELSYSILKEIYVNKAYAALELSNKIKDAENPKFVTNLVYGVLEKDTQFNYYIDTLVSKKPKNAIIILLKIGMYLVKYMNSMPTYAAVSNTVSLCESVGKREVKGFVNATLKKFSTIEFEMPKDKFLALSIESSTPLFIVKKLCNQYGYEKAKEFLMLPNFELEHVRVNSRKSTMKEIEDKIKDFVPSTNNSIYAKNDKVVKDLYACGKITIQSLSSMKACEVLAPNDGDKILDLCSAPGGKSIYMSELANVDIVSCDIHEHRLDLIKSYINRMGAQGISIKINDATILNEEFVDKFDKVLADVPCSGLGVANRKPDIYLNISDKDIKDLSEIQYKILCNAAKYVKKGGVLVYSTCTILREENQNNVNKFLKDNKDFKSVEEIQLLPNKEGLDGFYIHKMTRV